MRSRKWSSPQTWSRAGRVLCIRTATKLRCANSPLPDLVGSRAEIQAPEAALGVHTFRSGQGDDAAPELRASGGVDIVFAREGELSVGLDPVDRQPGA